MLNNISMPQSIGKYVYAYFKENQVKNIRGLWVKLNNDNSSSSSEC